MNCPKDILLLILSNLSYKDILTMATLNKSIAAVINESELWKKILIKEYELPQNILSDRLLNNDQKNFKKIFIKISKLIRRDLFVFNTPNSFFKDSLLLLAFIGATDLIEQYLKQPDAKINITDKNGRNALHYAALGENEQCFRFLLDCFKQKQISTGSDNEYTYLLNNAALGGHPSIIQTVITLRPGEINCQDAHGRNPLYFAVLSGNVNAVQFFLNHGGATIKDICDKIFKMSPLHHAALRGNFEIFKLLAETKQYNYFAQDSLHKNALHYAYQSQNEKIIQYIENASQVKLETKNRAYAFQTHHEKTLNVSERGAKFMFLKKQQTDPTILEKYGRHAIKVAQSF